ncbi:conjugal transfer protein TraG N-terminal domain-containing protein [Thiorhodovibrio winogradskyi]|uniref:conjugal transfer protein TraG N-terminal domain-containing protein n=1 Tax=Thiorhodovibrio winogradskyi TaxID=77007 RepID=UPI002E2DBF49|nr:conjugal transfer protein TraG N-terminal domain-containing protein [Thiorhodovibrio winogradskyi]
MNNTLYFGRLFIAMLIYLLAFGTSVSVTVEDAYTGSVRVVDNVPIGPAAVGAAMSNVGYGVTRLMEQAFSTPAMTGQGFADALQTLAGVRKATLSRASLGAANAPVSGTDVEGSLVKLAYWVMGPGVMGQDRFIFGAPKQFEPGPFL